jgi:hypothetical protein
MIDPAPSELDHITPLSAASTAEASAILKDSVEDSPVARVGRGGEFR